jgi:hypothetical protein
MKKAVVLFSVVVLIVLSFGETTLTWGVDPGCVNGDCPSNPGCTDGGCTPGDDSYKAGCCCGEPAALPGYRICCCKSDMVAQCRLSYGPTHILMDEVRICMGQLPSHRVGSISGPCGTAKASTCAPDWFPSREQGAWWPTALECGWMNQLDKCAQPQ